MVLTGAVREKWEIGHSRRWVLAAAGLSAAALTGCGLLDDDEPEPPKAPDPLEPLLAEALALAAAYDQAVVSQPGLRTRLAPLAEDHRTHAAEMSRLIGEPPASAPAPSAGAGPATTVAALRQAEQAAQKTAVAACQVATPDRAGLVGSIAACRATHAEALR
ncbi:hypothetical protein AB0J83_16585 [Actinoplanes sp. NPDC049596]|uniref:hypothetical protein n=1 Tax=unclassified Actinoplanes TaxID=2626549 RepID=UPI0034171108